MVSPCNPVCNLRSRGGYAGRSRFGIDQNPQWRSHSASYLGAELLQKQAATPTTAGQQPSPQPPGHPECGRYSDTRRWYLVMLRPGMDLLGALQIHRLGFEVFLPLIVERYATASWITPLFPGYCFAAFDPNTDCWSPINHATGVRRILGRLERPEPVPVGVVERLQRRVGPNGLIDERKHDDELKVGDTVELLDGPLAGSCGLLKMAGPHRVRVLLKLMGRTLGVTTDKRLIRRATAAASRLAGGA